MIVVAAGLNIIDGLFWVCGIYVLRFDDIFFMLCLGSILLIGDRSLRFMSKFNVDLFCLSWSLIFVTFIDDL